MEHEEMIKRIRELENMMETKRIGLNHINARVAHLWDRVDKIELAVDKTREILIKHREQTGKILEILEKDEA